MITFQKYNDHFYKIPSSLNVKEIMNLSIKAPAAILAINRSKKDVPLKDVSIVNSPNGYRIGISQVKDPYGFKYMPELIDVYPNNDEVNPGIAMFCFPEGIVIKKTMDMPKWFSFVLTDQDGKRSYGSCLILTEELSESLINSVRIPY